MTFGDEIPDPAPKRRKAGKKGKTAQQEEDEGVAVEMPDSEPAELSRTGAAEVAADADAVLPSSQGETSHIGYMTV